MLLIKDSNFQPYKEGEQVWLDVKNLKTMHPSHKLRAKRYGPFTVSKAISHVMYQLKLPGTWKIHNIFHASYLSPYQETLEHGPNYLEPPPNIIEGQPEWEIEAIIGMCLFGQKREKQYHVHWKGYSDAHDTWEPEQNIHALELLAEYHRNQTIHIKATRIEAKRDMFQPSHLEAPEQHPSAEPASHLTTPPSVYARILGVRYSERIIPLVAQQLEQGPYIPKVIAHPVSIQESIQEEQEATEANTVPTDRSMGNSSKDHKDHDNHHHERSLPQQESIVCRNINPCVTEEALLAQTLLRHPVLEHVGDWAYPDFHMGDTHNSTAPPPPWF